MIYLGRSIRTLADFYQEDLDLLTDENIDELLSDYIFDEDKVLEVTPRFLRKNEINYFEDLTFHSFDLDKKLKFSLAELKRLVRDTTIGTSRDIQLPSHTFSVGSLAIRRSHVIEIGTKMYELTNYEVDEIDDIISITSQIKILWRLMKEQLITLDEIIAYGATNTVVRTLAKNEISVVGQYLSQIETLNKLYERSIFIEKCWSMYTKSVKKNTIEKFGKLLDDTEEILSQEDEYTWWVKENILISKQLI